MRQTVDWDLDLSRTYGELSFEDFILSTHRPRRLFIFLHTDWKALMSEGPTCSNKKLNKRSSRAEQLAEASVEGFVSEWDDTIYYLLPSVELLSWQTLTAHFGHSLKKKKISRSLCWVIAWNVVREMILVSTFSLQPEFKEEEEREGWR